MTEPILSYRQTDSVRLLYETDLKKSFPPINKETDLIKNGTIFVDSWCYGLSPDIPWIFQNDKDSEPWFNSYDGLKRI